MRDRNAVNNSCSYKRSFFVGKHGENYVCLDIEIDRVAESILEARLVTLYLTFSTVLV